MTDTKQPEALRLAEILEGDYCPDWFYEQGVDEVAAELRRMHAENTTLQQGYDAARLEIESLQNERDKFRNAYLEWHEKTDWVQQSATPRELGKHRADVLRERIESLQAQLEAVGAGGVEPLRRRECLHQIAEPAPATTEKPVAGCSECYITHDLGACDTAAPAAQGDAGDAAQPCDAAWETVLLERDDADDFIDTLLDEVLGADRAEWSNLYGRADALNDVRERMATLEMPAIDRAWGRFEAAMNAAAAPKAALAAAAQGDALNEVRRTVAVIPIVGNVDGHAVVRRRSVLDILDRRIAARANAKEGGA